MSIIYTSESIYSGFLPHGTTASSIFGASSEASERPYHLNEPTSPSLINFLGRGRTKGGSGRDIYDRTDSMNVDNMVATSIAHKKHEDGRCEELWRAFRDDAGLWMAHRFDWDAWNDEEEKEDQDDLPDSFNGILTKAIIAPNLSKLEASPIYQNYAYTKCVLTKKKLNNIDLLQTYQYLQYLDLSFNKLTTLKPLGMLPFLKHLDASRNFLTTILDFKPPFFLTSVNLSRNKIKKIRDLSDFWSLTDLNLSHNMIKVIEGLKGLRYLSYLNLAFNNIETLENLSGLRVQFLFLQSNAIKIEEDDVKAQLDTLKNIRNVNLSYNQVLSLKIFEKVENLECLDIVNNNISKLLDIYYLRNLKYLNKLNLTGNPVTTLERYVEVCVTHIKNLIHLDNQKIDINLWMEKISNQNKDMHQIAAQHRLKLTVLEQLKPPEIWTWLSPYDEPPITVIVLVGLQASRRTYIVKKFCESNKK